LVVLNRFDKRGAPAAFGEGDLPPSSLEATNGAFWLLFLGEPESAGLDMERKIPEYRDLLGRLERVERLTWQVPPRSRSLGGRYWQLISDIPFPQPPDRDWPGFLRAERAHLTRLRVELPILLRRYERMIHCETVADFGYRVEWDRPYALQSFILATARLHAALAVIDAEGRALAASRRRAPDRPTASESAWPGPPRALFFYNLGRALVDTALEALAGLLSLPGCPPQVAESLLAGLPPLSPTPVQRPGRPRRRIPVGLGEDRARRPLAAERDRLREIVPGRRGDQARMALNVLLARELGPETYLRLSEAAFELFLMKNRTRGYFRDGLRRLLALDASPPFRWSASGRRRPFLQGPEPVVALEPVGKALFRGPRSLPADEGPSSGST
jgi:hypothetical protein